MRAQLGVSIGHHSTAGAKDANQDFHGSLVPDGEALAAKGIALALADGISTSALGAVAAETAVKTFLTDYYATSEAWSVRTSAQRVISATNSWMHAQNLRSQPGPLTDEARERGMVCTFTALVLKSRAAHLFHIGDARIARVAGRRLEPLTEAHRVDLGGGESYLGRALGVNRHVEIDFRRIAVQPGDIFVLTTDGVHDHLPDAAIVDALADGDLDAAARATTAAALAAGSPDNLTVQFLRVDTVPEGTIADLIGAETSLRAAPQLRAGQHFEGYTVLRELHAGSRSHVYLARDDTNGAKVALKIPATEHAEREDQLQMLLLEEWVARLIDNPHVLKAAPMQAPRRHAFSAMVYVEGRTLEEWMHDHPLPEPAAIRPLVKQIAAGLQAFHRREMLHRDLRPANILVDADGTARIIDFGSVQVAGLDELATVRVDDAAFAGTMQYSAPELYLGEPASRQSDIYSLGVIAYRMLTGRLPYGPRIAAATTRAAQCKLRYAPVTEWNAQVPDWVDAAIARAVAFDPARRYDELSEFVFDLSRPNAALVAPDARPLFQRRPERLWQAVSFVLLCIALFSWFAQ